MKDEIWVVEHSHHRSRCGWTDNYIVVAGSEEEAIEKVKNSERIIDGVDEWEEARGWTVEKPEWEGGIVGVIWTHES